MARPKKGQPRNEPQDYYSKKSRASRLINELYINGKDDESIKLQILLSFGFGDKFVDMVLDRLEAVANLNEEAEESKNKKIKK